MWIRAWDNWVWVINLNVLTRHRLRFRSQYCDYFHWPPTPITMCIKYNCCDFEMCTHIFQHSENRSPSSFQCDMFFSASRENMLFYSSTSLLGWGRLLFLGYILSSQSTLDSAILFYVRCCCSHRLAALPLSAPLYRRKPRNMCCGVRLHI